MPHTTTPNMSLTLPTVGSEPGPSYASEINSSLSTVDQHDHTSGNGVSVPAAGLNINTDLPFGSNNATGLRSARFVSQGSPLSLGTDLGCLYESGVDLYYNDGNGNQIRITQSGGIAGTSGSISGLTSPASATYNAGSATFTWQSNSNVAANMDFRSAILRNSSVSSNGITLSAPSSLPSNFTLTLPSALPGAQNFATIDSSGNIASNWAVDGSTIVVSSNTVQVPAGGIGTPQLANLSVTTAKIADANITYAKIQATNSVIGSSSGAFSTTSATPVAVTNLSNVMTVSGSRPMIMMLTPASTTTSNVREGLVSQGSSTGYLYFYQDTTLVATIELEPGTSAPAGGFSVVFIPSAGNSAFNVKISTNSTATVSYCALFTHEMV